jgi:oxygen-dependent protoporphyrinogen oxidase
MAKNYDVIIVGGGLTGLTAGHFLRKFDPELKVCILEGSGRPGGAIRTFREEGYQAEWGPHGFLNNTPESRQLLTDIGLDQEMQTAPLGDFRRFICFKGKLEALPQNPKMLLSTPLLSMAGKLRLLGDLWKKPRFEDQTIGAWAEYRFGKEVLPMVDVAVTGTYAGDLHRLSIDSVMPGVRQLEKENGSVLRGLKNKKKGVPGGEGGLPAMINFPEGMERLIKVLADGAPELFLASPVAKISREEEQWLVSAGGEDFQARNLIMALPVNSSLDFLSSLAKPPVKKVPGARIANVVLAFPEGAEVPRGFGYLAPDSENRFTLGAMFSSHMFPDRCPSGQVLLEALVGGRRHPDRFELSDHELISKVCTDIGQLMKLPEKPVFAKVLRSEGEIPQQEMDHPSLLEWRRKTMEKFSGLYVCGFGWDGIGMNDVIKSAARVAEAVAEKRQLEGGKAPVKPVYF